MKPRCDNNKPFIGSLEHSSLPPRAQSMEPSHNSNGAHCPATEMGVVAV